jgi:hypothetical protein
VSAKRFPRSFELPRLTMGKTEQQTWPNTTRSAIMGIRCLIFHFSRLFFLWPSRRRRHGSRSIGDWHQPVARRTRWPGATSCEVITMFSEPLMSEWHLREGCARKLFGRRYVMANQSGRIRKCGIKVSNLTAIEDQGSWRSVDGPRVVASGWPII